MKKHAYLLAFWPGRLTELSLALDRARTGPLPPRVQARIDEAFFATNRALVYLREEERPLSARRKKPRAGEKETKEKR